MKNRDRDEIITAPEGRRILDPGQLEQQSEEMNLKGM